MELSSSRIVHLVEWPQRIEGPPPAVGLFGVGLEGVEFIHRRSLGFGVAVS